MDYWFYFMHKSIELIKPYGIISFITSRYWINSSGAKKLIKHIKNEMSFIDIVDIGDVEVFEKVVGYHMISILQKATVIKETSYKKISDRIENVIKNKFEEKRYIPEENLITDDFEIILEKRTDNKYDLKLDDVCAVFQGIVEASDKISNKMYKKNPNPKHYVNEGIFVLSNEEYDSLELTQEEKNIFELYEEEGCINRYFTNYHKTRHLIYSDAKNRAKIANNKQFKHIKKHLDYMAEYITSTYKPYGLHRARIHDDFTQEKIIGPSMFCIPNFTFDDKNLFVGMSYNNVIAKNDTELKFILGLLNSSYAKDWFYKNAKHRGSGVDVGVDKLRTFPIPAATPAQQQQIIALADKILAMKKRDSSADTTVLEEKIDELVYKLYEVNNIYGNC